MAQVFRPSSNTLSRASLLSVILLPAALLMAGSTITRSPYNTKVAVPLDQPVPFSHEHHAVELGIDCRYCHSTVEKSSFAGIPPTHTCMSCHSQIWTNSPLLEPVRQSYQTDTPIQWVRINRLPDFVYFNHSIHVNKGVNCNVCHGTVNKMQMTYKGKPFWMSWCLECHREPWKFLRPREEVFNVYYKLQAGKPLTHDEFNLTSDSNYAPNQERMEEGKRLVQQYNIKAEKGELTDCWICHR